MELSLVITTRNRKDEFLRCLQSIKNSDLSGLDWELIVVDDNSSDGTEKLELEELGIKAGKVIHNQKQEMMVRSRNIGARIAQGEYVLFIDDDNVIDNQMVRNLIDFGKKNKNCGIIGPAMFYQDTKKKYMDCQKISFFSGKTYFYVDKGKTDFCQSDGIPNVFMIRKEVFERAGFFDEKLIQTWTEPDFAFNARKFGYQCAIVKNAVTFHNISRSTKFNPNSLGGNFPQKTYCLMRNRTLIISRYGNWHHKIIYLLFFSWMWPMVYSLVVLRQKRWDLVKNYWLGFWDGLVYFFTGKLKNSYQQ